MYTPVNPSFTMGIFSWCPEASALVTMLPHFHHCIFTNYISSFSWTHNWYIIYKYHNNPKNLDGQGWGNSVDPGQMPSAQFATSAVFRQNQQVVMHQTFAITAPWGRGIAGIFDFLLYKAQVYALHCGGGGGGGHFLCRITGKGPRPQGLHPILSYKKKYHFLTIPCIWTDARNEVFNNYCQEGPVLIS